MNEGTVLLPTSYIADYCDVTERTVCGWIRNGDLPAVRLGGQYRIRPEDFEAFLDEREVGRYR